MNKLTLAATSALEPERLRVAAAQMNTSENVEQNLLQAEHLISKASEQCVDFISLPESFALMANQSSQRHQVAESHRTGKIQTLLSKWASKYQIAINAGTLLVKDEPELQEIKYEKFYARSYFFDKTGQYIDHYDKVHLFDVWLNPKENYQESAHVIAGETAKVITLEGAKIGASVCYDLRFPYLYSLYNAEECLMVTVPSAFTYHTGQAHWKTLLKARALDSQCYIIAANQNGMHQNGRRSFGHSAIVSPWGELLDQCDQETGLAIATLDLNYPSQCRRKLPLQNHKRKI